MGFYMYTDSVKSQLTQMNGNLEQTRPLVRPYSLNILLMYLQILSYNFMASLMIVLEIIIQALIYRRSVGWSVI